MFLNFYGLKQQPFGVTPDARYLYLSNTHREALASLFYGIETGRGFMAMVAKPGMGKTTLLVHLAKEVSEHSSNGIPVQHAMQLQGIPGSACQRTWF